jgi:O-antigen/teichoic acid export membrane protein
MKINFLLRHQTTYDAFLYIIRSYGLSIIGVVKLFFLLKLLPLEVFGQTQFIIAIHGLMFIFTLNGMSVSTVQFVARKKEYLYPYFQKIRTKLAIIPLVIFQFIGFYYYYSHQDYLVALAFSSVGLLFPLYVKNALSSLLVGRKQFILLMRIEWSGQFLASIVTIFFAWLYPNNIFLIVFPSFLILTLSWIIGEKIIKIDSYIPENNEIKSEWSYIKHRTLIGIFPIIDGRIDRVIIGLFFDFKELAIFSLAKFTMEQLTTFAKAILNIFLQKFSTMNEAKLYNSLLKLTVFYTIIIILVGVLIDIGAVLVIKYYLNGEFSNSIPYIHWLIFGVVCSSPGAILQVYFVSQKKIKYEYLFRSLIPIFYFIALLLLLPLFEIQGVIYSLVIKGIFVTLITGLFFIIFIYRKEKWMKN